MTVSETWLKDKVDDSEVIDENIGFIGETDKLLEGAESL